MVNFESKYILIVEDDDMNFIYFKQIFRLLKIEYDRVKSGTAAVEICQSKKFDAIMMDIQLPGLNGYEATQAIRQFDKETPIIAQTASRNSDEIDKALQSGCNDLLVKPFRLDDVVKILNKIF